jgi:hypothetical protein
MSSLPSVEGWTVVIAFLPPRLLGHRRFHPRTPGGGRVRSANLLFMAWLRLLVGLLILICWLTGERPRWRWGIGWLLH